MASLVVVTVADGREALGAELAVVGLLAGVDADVYLQVAPLVELLVAQQGLAGIRVGAHYFRADEILVFLFQVLLGFVLSFGRSEILLNEVVMVLFTSLLII